MYCYLSFKGIFKQATGKEKGNSLLKTKHLFLQVMPKESLHSTVQKSTRESTYQT